MTLVDALAADGLVCVVGAGGKKSTLYALAGRLDRPVVTATVRIPIFDPHVERVQVTGDPVSALRAADAADFPLGLVPEHEPDRDRYLGYDPATVAEIAREGIADAVLVKADGARMREFKAPGENEPRVPVAADTVLPVASAGIVGRPLSADLVHRPERVADLAGLPIGEEIRPEHVARVLAHEDGGLKGAPADATVVPVLNKVDDAAAESAANRVGVRLLEHERIDRVALTCLVDDDPLVSILE